MSLIALRKYFLKKYFKLSNNSYDTDYSQSNNEDYFSPNLSKEAMVFKDIIGAKNDDAFKIELNESIFIRQIKIDIYQNMLAIIKKLNEEIDSELSILRN